MRNYIAILILLFISSCQVLDKREVELSKTFCNDCKKPLRDILLNQEGVYVVKYKEGNRLFYNYDDALVDIDSLETVLSKKGYLPRKDSIVLYPICCNTRVKEEVSEIDSLVVE